MTAYQSEKHKLYIALQSAQERANELARHQLTTGWTAGYEHFSQAAHNIRLALDELNEIDQADDAKQKGA